MRVDFKLELAALDSTHLELIRKWRNDYSIYRWCRQTGPISDVEQKAWYERQSRDPSIQMFLVQAFCEGKTTPVGVAGFTSIDYLNRRAEFSLYIGPEYQQRGYGREALKLLLLQGFANMGLQQIWGESFDGNPAIPMFKSLGFRGDGVRRKFYLKDGKFHDALLFSILAKEWMVAVNPSGKPDSDSSDSVAEQPSNPVVPSVAAEGHPSSKPPEDTQAQVIEASKTRSARRRRGMGEGTKGV